jgi:hypothetical protein
VREGHVASSFARACEDVHNATRCETFMMAHAAQGLNKFRVIKMQGFKTKELRRSARSCTELRGVDVEEGRTFSFCFVPSSRVAKVNRGPSLMGSTSENSSEIQSLVEKVQKKRQSRDGWRTCASFGSVPDADCEDRARGKPRTKPHLCEAK